MIQNLIKKLSAYRLSILSGLLIGTSYIPFPPWALFFCLVPLFLFWFRATNAKQVFWSGWLTQFILNMIGFHWIAYTAVEFGHLPWWMGALTLLGFSAIAHLYYPIAGVFWFVLQKRFQLKTPAALLAMALFFVLIQTLYPHIFPWHLGYPWLWIGLPGVHVADIIGFNGLNLLTVVLNAAVAWAFLVSKKSVKKRNAILASSFSILAAVNIFGFFRQKQWNEFDTKANFLLVQGNIGNLEKMYAIHNQDYQDVITEKYLQMSSEGLEKFPETDIVLWPETAFPDNLDPRYEDNEYPLMVRDFAAEAKRPLLTGAYSKDRGSRNNYNAFFVVDENGKISGEGYRKTILLAFGEYFPGADWFPFLKKLVPTISDFKRGKGPTVFKVGEHNIGPQICYEGLYPDFSAGLSQKGADIFVNVTNDSWFGNHFEPYQHLYMTFARAIEFRRPLVRSTNTGISTAILANGEILQKSPLHEEWSGLFTIPYKTNAPKTIYEKIHWMLPWALVIGLVLLLVLGRGRSKGA